VEEGEKGNGVSVEDLAVSIVHSAENLYTLENSIWVWCLVRCDGGVAGGHDGKWL